MDFKKERVNAHNNWPEASVFKAEAMFTAKLAARKDARLFKPVQLAHGGDADYQRCIGHLIDALDALPERPDYAFDHFFRIIDFAGKPLGPKKKGITGVVGKLGTILIQKDGAEWKGIIDALCEAMPMRTREFLAKRLIEAGLPTASDIEKQLNTRAINCFHLPFHDAFIQKYTLDQNGAVIPNAATTNRAKAASLLKLYLSGVAGTRTKKASFPALDLTKKQNVPNHSTRAEVILSLLLFTIRNERAHGNSISPFRTSKANLERYESYYFTMLAAYVFALGVMMLRFDCTSSALILDGCRQNIQLQESFFSGPLPSGLESENGLAPISRAAV